MCARLTADGRKGSRNWVLKVMQCDTGLQQSVLACSIGKSGPWFSNLRFGNYSG
eukprot:CAMPEP_0174743932 /NCGR_PEP_ID=MMETSP1094-20130205/82917_1 /TAXON_ID=156173 /ORGANISM="Chrysochromulina brevifilum, Strain UTEX LB 985" /LENGTH=53 /DNA_ID=CAMNT_0015948225 /DNA_START=305 /DNA_END=462 /DNA_ORIENTATION=+